MTIAWWIVTSAFASDPPNWLESTGFEVDKLWIECRPLGAVVDGLRAHPSIVDGVPFPPAQLAKLADPAVRDEFGLPEDGWLGIAFGTQGVMLGVSIEGSLQEGSKLVQMLTDRAMAPEEWRGGVVEIGHDLQVQLGEGIMVVRQRIPGPAQGGASSLMKEFDTRPVVSDGCVVAAAASEFDLDDPSGNVVATFPFAKDQPIVGYVTGQTLQDWELARLPSWVSTTLQRPVGVITGSTSALKRMPEVFGARKGADGAKVPLKMVGFVVDLDIPASTIFAKFAAGGMAAEIFPHATRNRREATQEVSARLRARGAEILRRRGGVIEFSMGAEGSMFLRSTEGGSTVIATTHALLEEIHEPEGHPWLNAEELAFASRHAVSFSVGPGQIPAITSPITAGMTAKNGRLEVEILDRGGSLREQLLQSMK